MLYPTQRTITHLSSAFLFIPLKQLSLSTECMNTPVCFFKLSPLHIQVLPFWSMFQGWGHLALQITPYVTGAGELFSVKDSASYFMGFEKVKREGKTLSVCYVCSRSRVEGQNRLRKDDL